MSTSDWLLDVAVSPDGATVAAGGTSGLHVFDVASLASSLVAGVGARYVAFAAARRVLSWQGATMFDVDLTSGAINSVPTAPGGQLGGFGFQYDPGTGSAYVVKDQYSPQTGVPWTTEIVAVDVAAGTWSSRQYSRILTIPAVTPSGNLLVAETKAGGKGDFLGIYYPSPQTLWPELCPTAPSVRDLKVHPG